MNLALVDKQVDRLLIGVDTAALLLLGFQILADDGVGPELLVGMAKTNGIILHVVIPGVGQAQTD